MKKILGFSALIAGFLLIAFLSYRAKQTVYNEAGTLGNSSGNLFNQGLFCEYKDKIYFSNPADQGRLYVMDEDFSHAKRLSLDTATYINVAGKYIIYGRHNEKQDVDNNNVFGISKTGLFRINLNGKSQKTLFDSVVSVVALYGNTVYYQHNTSSGIGISQIDLDKSNAADTSTEAIFPYAFTNGKMYYTGVTENHYIYETDLETGNSSVYRKGNYAFLTTLNDTLYFLDLAQNHALCSLPLNGSEPTVLVKEPTSTYNLSPDGLYLYYEVDDGTNNGIYRMNTTDGTTTCLLKGNYSNIFTTEKYAFFKELNKDKYYVVEHNNSSEAVAFNPETE